VTDRLDCVVVGAGVVGLAVGRALALAGREVVVLESESHIGMHASSRNSEVIHAGLYYPEDFLKARLCVTGKKMLYDYCDEHGVGCSRLGKLVVASSIDDLDRLTVIGEQAARNGVTDLVVLSADEVRELEPNVLCAGALLSPSTGIVDSHELMTALQAEIEAHNGTVLLNSEVTNLSAEKQALRFMNGNEWFFCRTLVNSAGLRAQKLVSGDGRPRERVPALHLAKGHYFAYSGKSPFKHLIYPLPSGGGLGIHATNDLGGATRFGPDVTWIDSIDYDFDENRKPEFITAIRSYFPGLDQDKLTPAYTGIRPKLSGPGEPPADFVIHSEADHGVPGLVNLFGIDSPGLTAALAIGEFVNKMLSS